MQSTLQYNLDSEKTAFIQDNQNLIYSIMKKFPNYKDKEDLYQVGLIGMNNAYDNYDVGYNTKPTTYAYQYAFGEMKKYVSNDRTIKVSRDYLRISKSVEQARISLAQSLMKEPTNEEIATFLEIDESIIADIEMVLNYVDSLDRPTYTNENTDYYNTVTNNYQLDFLEKLFLYEQLESLDEIERIIVENRYFYDKTQEEIANELGINQVQVSRILKKSLIKMRANYQM